MRFTSVLVLDDSTSTRHARHNRAVLKTIEGLHIAYHGRTEQRRALDELTRQCPGLHPLIEPHIRLLGEPAWDLGAVRNYAILLASATTSGNATVMYLDDDIRPIPPSPPGNPVRSSLGLLRDCVERSGSTIAGSRLCGTPDASCVERSLLKYMAAMGTTLFSLPRQPVPISGGLMAFNVRWGQRNPFPRNYNEDWMWLALCRHQGAKLRRTRAIAVHASVTQQHCHPIQLKREQFGEILCDGWTAATRGGLMRQLRSPLFWRDIKRDEIRYLMAIRKRLSAMSHTLKGARQIKAHREAWTLLSSAIDAASECNEEEIRTHVVRYLSARMQWRRAMQTIAGRSQDRRSAQPAIPSPHFAPQIPRSKRT